MSDRLSTGDTQNPARPWLVAATVSGVLVAGVATVFPRWALPLTIGAALALGWLPFFAGRTGRTVAAVLASAATAGLVLRLVVEAPRVASGSQPPDSLLETLTTGCLLLTIASIPAFRTIRQQRTWLALNGTALGGALAATHSALGYGIAVVGWILLIVSASILHRTSARESVTVIIDSPNRDRPAAQRLAFAWQPTLASVVAAALMFLMLPASAGGADSIRRLVGLVDEPHASAYFGSRAFFGVDTDATGQLYLNARGHLGHAPLLQVPAHSPQLWRSSVYKIYTGNAWLASDGREHFSLLRGSSVTVDGALAHAGQHYLRRYSARTLSPELNRVAWAPGTIVSLTAPTSRVLDDGHSLRFVGASVSSTYQVRVYEPGTHVAGGSALAAVYPSTVSSVWTALPADVPARVAQLAQSLTRDHADRAAKVEAIRRYLTSHELYSEDSPVPGRHEDAVDAFLFRDHVGFCEQFASAEAVLLREVGVPARVVTGLAYGEPSGSSRLFRESDAHAWVEIYFPGRGWVTSDPTAGARPAPVRTAGAGTSWRVTLALGTGGLLLLVLVIFSLRAANRRRRRTGDAEPATPNELVAAFFAFVRSGRPKARGETAREYVSARVATDNLNSAVAILEQDCYGSAPPTPEESTQATASFITAARPPH